MYSKNLIELPGARSAILGLHLLLTAVAQAQLVPLQQATATYSQTGYEVGTAIDGIFVYPINTPGGWGVLNGASAASETAVFETVSDVGFSNYTVLAFTLFQTHWNAQHTLGRFRLSVTTDARSNFADGLSTGGQIGSNWTVLIPRMVLASNGAALTTLSDQSIRASGISPGTSTYVIEALTPLTNITGIRVEAMEDTLLPLLPFDGPGRYPINGNFVLSEIQLRASAATNIYWTNTVNGNWSNTDNWSPNRLPTSADHAHITADGTYSVFQDVSATVLSLTLGGNSGTQTLVSSSPSVTLSTPNGKINSNGLLSLGGGNVSGTNTIYGTVDWVSGSVAGTRLTVAPGGRLNISGGSTKSLTGILTNAGTVTWTNTAPINFGGSGVLYNLAGALFDVRSDSAINGSGSFVHNTGTFRKSAGTGTNFIQPTFINYGTVEVLTGTLSFNGGGTNNALFNVGNGAAIQNPSGFTFANGSQLLGLGTNRWTGGTITLNGDLNAANLELAGATVAGAGMLSVSNLNFFSGTFDGTNTVSGVANWRGGSIPGTARLTIATNGVLNISGATTKIIGGALINAGLITWTGTGAISFGAGGFIQNLSGAVFDVQTDSSLTSGFSAPAFYNLGLFRKSASSGTNLVSIAFSNDGTVEIATGGLNVGSQFVQTGGAMLLKGGKLLAGSTMSFEGGLLAGSGPIIGFVRMSGQLSPGLSPGLLQITGAYAQGAIGSYNCEIGGTNAGTAYDQVTATGPATLAGTINVLCVSNYVPALGARFEIMKFASRTGTPKFQGLDISNGLSLLPVFSPTNLVLVATNAPLNAAPKMNLARNGDSFWLWWPLGYGGFNVQSTTNLNAPIAWSPVTPAEGNRHTFQSAEPMKFFRMIQP